MVLSGLHRRLVGHLESSTFSENKYNYFNITIYMLKWKDSKQILVLVGPMYCTLYTTSSKYVDHSADYNFFNKTLANLQHSIGRYYVEPLIPGRVIDCPSYNVQSYMSWASHFIRPALTMILNAKPQSLVCYDRVGPKPKLFIYESLSLHHQNSFIYGQN